LKLIRRKTRKQGFSHNASLYESGGSDIPFWAGAAEKKRPKPGFPFEALGIDDLFLLPNNC